MKEIKSFWGEMYGIDCLSLALIVLSLILNLITVIHPQGSFLLLGVIGVLLLILVILRSISRQVVSRQEENRAFLNLIEPLTQGMDQRAEEKAQKKIFRFYNCPSCKQRIRVPKGQGRIEITCPQCQTKFIKKS